MLLRNSQRDTLYVAKNFGPIDSKNGYPEVIHQSNAVIFDEAVTARQRTKLKQTII